MSPQGNPLLRSEPNLRAISQTSLHPEFSPQSPPTPTLSSSFSPHSFHIPSVPKSWNHPGLSSSAAAFADTLSITLSGLGAQEHSFPRLHPGFHRLSQNPSQKLSLTLLYPDSLWGHSGMGHSGQTACGSNSSRHPSMTRAGPSSKFSHMCVVLTTTIPQLGILRPRHPVTGSIQGQPDQAFIRQGSPCRNPAGPPQNGPNRTSGLITQGHTRHRARNLLLPR